MAPPRSAALRWPVWLCGVGFLVGCFADAAIGRFLDWPVGPALAADIGVGMGLVVFIYRPLVGAAIACAASVTVSLGVALIRRWPAEVSWQSQSALPGVAELVGLALLVGVAVARLARVHAGLVVAGAALTAGLIMLRDRSGREVVWSALFGAGLVVSCSIGLYVRGLGRAQLATAAAARADERGAIARELHDVVAHHVTAMVIRAQSAQVLPGEQPLRAALVDIERSGADALGAMRSIVGALRGVTDAPLGPADPIAALRSLATEPGAPGPAVSIRVASTAGFARPAALMAVERIASEAVTNARRHAQRATSITVAVERDVDALRVIVADDGLGGVIRQGGFGVIGMRERAEALGGYLRAGPADRGWLVEAVVPCADAVDPAVIG